MEEIFYATGVRNEFFFMLLNYVLFYLDAHDIFISFGSLAVLYLENIPYAYKERHLQQWENKSFTCNPLGCNIRSMVKTL